MSLVTKRSMMTFFSDSLSHYSHRVRIVLAEKGVTVDVVNLDPRDPPQELAEINPYSSLPTLLDRELVLYESKIMMEYLDERFPHPPLMPVYPVARAESRQIMYRIERDWCVLVDSLLAGGPSRELQKARKDLRDGLLGMAPAFSDKPFFLSDEFTLVDCCMAPILWRLPLMGIELPKTKQTKALTDYMKRLFTRPGFRASLSEREREMHKL